MTDGNFDKLTVNQLSTLKGVVDVQGDIRINDKDLWLRKGTDQNNGIGWYGAGKPFAGSEIEGPVLIGLSGGALGTTDNGEKIALRWDSHGNVLGNSGYFNRLQVYLTGFPKRIGNYLIDIHPDVENEAIYIIGNIERPGKPKNRLFPLSIALQPQGGNVGIGTDKPTHKFHVVADDAVGLFESTGTQAYLRLSTKEGLNNRVEITNRPGGRLSLWTSGAGDIFNITQGGNVGIGTTSPSEKLEVHGNIKVTGDIFLTNADCAEEFDVAGADSVEPGTVMVIDGDGGLRPSEQAYDKRVAGVISGAGDLRPGITLEKKNERSNRLPLALTGKVYCKIDAQYSPIEVGDLLTTSQTSGHAMKASDPVKAFGSVIGKALRSIEMGRGMIPILVALQ